MHRERSYTHKNKEDILTNPKDSESIIKDGKEVFNFFFFFFPKDLIAMELFYKAVTFRNLG